MRGGGRGAMTSREGRRTAAVLLAVVALGSHLAGPGARPALAQPPAETNGPTEGDAELSTDVAIDGYDASESPIPNPIPATPLPIRFPAQGDDRENPYDQPGTYDVAKSNVTIDIDGTPSRALFYTPVANDTEKGPWPAIVFAHGFCSEPELYDAALTFLTSWGFAVVANAQEAVCDINNVAEVANTNTTKYRDDVIAGFKWLQQQPEVNASMIAIAGHSMGGGAAIDAAASLAESDPGAVKSVVGIAPWNGVKPMPSTVVDKIKAPIMLVCSANDTVIPCSGRVTYQVMLPTGVSIPLTNFLSPSQFGPEVGDDWGGGVKAIYGNATSSRDLWYLAVENATHFSVSNVDSILFLDAIEKGSSLKLQPQLQMDWSVEDNPTWDHTIAFLLMTMFDDEAAKDWMYEEADAPNGIKFLKTRPG